jgi:hypothetical protein
MASIDDDVGVCCLLPRNFSFSVSSSCLCSDFDFDVFINEFEGVGFGGLMSSGFVGASLGASLLMFVMPASLSLKDERGDGDLYCDVTISKE